MSFPLRCSDKQALGYITHEASTLSRVSFPVRQFVGTSLLTAAPLLSQTERQGHMAAG